MPEGLTVHRLIPLFKDWNEVQTRRGEINRRKSAEAVYGLKEPPQEETVEIIRMSEVDTQTVEWLWKTVYPLWESNHSTGQPRRGKDHICAAPCRLYYWRDASGHEAHATVSSNL